MSLAGAQHKMVVVLRGNALFEPLPGTPSTHILKPPALSEHYPASVMNEYFTMRLAHDVGIIVPKVARLYTPEPVYLVERFDRVSAPGSEGITRTHTIDTCQLLNASRVLKYRNAQLQTLHDAIAHCRSKAAARLQLYRWTLFNVLIGNGDNHLKNVSFRVSTQGIELAPAYDLLCTAVYATTAFAHQNATWPNVALAVSLHAVNFFSEVTRDCLLRAGTALGLSPATALRELQRMEKKLPLAADALIADIEAHFESLISASPEPETVRAHKGGELMLLRAIRHIVLRDMLERIKAA